jgi:hypothetical protein
VTGKPRLDTTDATDANTTDANTTDANATDAAGEPARGSGAGSLGVYGLRYPVPARRRRSRASFSDSEVIGTPVVCWYLAS